MARERGIIRILVKNIIDSLKPRPFKGTCMGTDYLGNKYFEITAESNNGRRRRWFMPKEKENFEQELPAEWESWLRGRRREPPTEDEITRNIEIMKMKQINAEELKIKYQSNTNQSVLEEERKGQASFPTYNEYELVPGKKPK